LSAIRQILVFSLVCIVLADSCGRRAHATDISPVDVIEAGVAIMAQAKAKYGSRSEGDEQELLNAVRLFLAEYTDVQYAARLILSRHWETATSEQRDRFVAAFDNLVTTRVAILVPDIEFDSVRIEPFLGDTEDIPLMIQATFRNTDNQITHFVLVTHKRKGNWLIFDVIAEGVSYVKTYRNQVNGEIEDIGLEAMLKRFELRSSERGNG